jgi:hypothetical protein
LILADSHLFFGRAQMLMKADLLTATNIAASSGIGKRSAVNWEEF